TCTDDTYTFTVDRTAPQISIDPVPDPSNAPALSITFAVTGNPTQVTCQLDGSAPTPCTSPFATPTLSNAVHMFTVAASDAANNSTTASISWTTDTIAPSVTLTGGPTGATNLNPLPTFTFTASGSPISTQCAFDGDPLVDCSGGSFPVPA